MQGLKHPLVDPGMLIYHPLPKISEFRTFSKLDVHRIDLVAFTAELACDFVSFFWGGGGVLISFIAVVV